MEASVQQHLRSGEALPLSRATEPVGRALLGSRLGLSARLLLLTVAFVGLAEILIYVPAVAYYRRSLLSDRITSAQVAALVLDAVPNGTVSEDTSKRILASVGARSIIVQRGATRRVLAIGTMPNAVADTVDLRAATWFDSIYGAWRTLTAPADMPIRAIGRAPDATGADLVEILLDAEPLRASVMAFSIRLALSSLMIAAAAAGLVFIVLQRVIVRPVRRLARNMSAFAQNPEQADCVFAPSKRTDEIGHAESALARMEITLSGALRQKRRLAELGVSVSKINHELRNLLTTAQLLGDRLAGVTDPVVQRVAPRLVGTLDRAIQFCEATLAYGGATEQHPRRQVVSLVPLMEELSDLGGLSSDGAVGVTCDFSPGLRLEVDPEQLARALTNLVRNAVQALDASGSSNGPALVTVTARRDGHPGAEQVTILVSDNGPGVPERARAHLFTPFQGSARAGGTGLGLAIAAELVELNGGTLSLDPTSVGTRFRMVFPERPPA